MKKLIPLLLIFNCVGCQELQVNECIVPKDVINYLKIHFKQSKIIYTKDLARDWKLFAPDSSVCPVMINLDLTGNGANDFVFMIRKIDGMPFLIVINDYETNKVSHQVIEGVADYGGYGIGNIIYLDEKRKGFYFHKLESSIARVYWKKGRFELDYVVD